jgi:hypothetical protein
MDHGEDSWVMDHGEGMGHGTWGRTWDIASLGEESRERPSGDRGHALTQFARVDRDGGAAVRAAGAW